MTTKGEGLDIPEEAVEAEARRMLEASSVSKGPQPGSAQVNDRIKQQFRADARDYTLQHRSSSPTPLRMS